MKLYATNSQRLCATLLDFILLEIFVEIFTRLIILITGFDTAAYDTALDAIMNELTIMGEYAAAGEIYEYSYLIQALKEFMPYYLVKFAITGSLTLVFCIGYFVVLAKLWTHQTIGRFVLKVKVIKNNDEPVSWGNLILREIVGTFLMYNVFGYIIIFASIILCLVSRRSLVDYIGGTQLVVDIPKEKEEEIKQAYENIRNYQNQRNNGDYYSNDNPYRNDNDYIDAEYKDLDDSDQFSPYNREDNNSNESDDDSDDEYKIF